MPIDGVILIVQEYRDAIEKFKSEGFGYQKGACILGQPGIGKSYFITYAVTERLRERQPVAVHVFWHQPNSYILFSEDSVTLHTFADSEPLNLPGIWAFSDSNEELDKIPPYAYRRTPGVRVFQTTCAVGSHWKEWTKQCDIDLYFMDLWSVEEIEDLAFIFHPGKVDLVKNLANQWGPVPRMLLLAMSNPQYIKSYEATLDDIIAAAVNNPKPIFSAILNLDNALQSDSSSVFFVKPLNKETRSIFSVSIPTHSLIDRLVTALERNQVRKKVEFLQSLCDYSKMHSVAECIFEQMVHSSHSLVDGQSPPILEHPSLDAYISSTQAMTR